MFNTFDEYLEFCKLLHNTENSTYNFLKNSALYLYKSKYYLCVYENDINSFKSFHYSIIEFATRVTNSDLFEQKLKEYGKEIFKTNAINSCIKHFK